MFCTVVISRIILSSNNKITHEEETYLRKISTNVTILDIRAVVRRLFEGLERSDKYCLAEDDLIKYLRMTNFKFDLTSVRKKVLEELNMEI